MNSTQNRKISQITEDTLIVGIDIASELQYARAFDWRGMELSKKAVSFHNTLEGFEGFVGWLKGLQDRYSKEKVLAVCEPTGHYWFCLAQFLQGRDIKLVLVNPYHVKRSKELDDNTPSKTDSKDPKTIAKLAIEGRYMEPYIPEGIYAELRTLYNMYLSVNKEISSKRNRVARWLKIYFPEYDKVYGNAGCKSGILILQTAPLPQDILKLGIDGIVEIWRSAKLRGVGVKRATSLYNAAKSSIGLQTGGNAVRMEIRHLLDDLARKEEEKESIEAAMDETSRQIPGAGTLCDIKGVGRVTVAGFFAEVGDIRRFESPRQIQKLAGLALRESSSGKHKGETKISHRGRKNLRTLLFRNMLPLVAKNKEFAELHRYYTTRQKNPLKKKQSLVALCGKLIRVFYAMVMKKSRYDGNRLMSDIHRPEMAA